MKIIAEFSFFLGLATASHLALFQSDSIGAPSAAGDGGKETITLAASTDTLAAIVQNWERPVEVLQDVAMPQPVAPTAQQSAAVRSPQPAAPVQMHAPALEAASHTPDTAPQVDLSVPPPPDTFAAKASPRPVVRPAPQPAQAVKPTAKQTTKKKTQPASAQLAAGAGQRKVAGTAKPAKTPAKTQAARPALMAQWGSQIRAAVERRKKYPSGTRARGKVVLAVAVSSNGALSSVKVRSSSGHAALDQAAVSAVRNARFKAAPKGLPAGVHRFSLPITFAP